MPTYRSFLDDRYTYAVMLGLGAYMPVVMQRAFADFTATDTECVYTWRGLMSRTVPERKILLRGAVLRGYWTN